MLEIIPVFWQQFKDNKRRVLVLYRGGVSSSVCCEQNETQLEPAAPKKETRVCIFILYTGEKYIYIYQGNKNIRQNAKREPTNGPNRIYIFFFLLHEQVD